MKLFGIKAGDSWLKTGLSLTIVISSVTGVFMFFQLKNAHIEWQQLQNGIIWVLLFSLSNSFGEEMIYRMGIVSPLGVGVAHVWNRLIRRESRIPRIESFPTEDFSTKIAGLVPHGDGVGELDFDNLFSVADRKRNGSFILYAMAASDEA